jgi:hypothetical protein
VTARGARRPGAPDALPRPARAPETLARHVEPVRNRNERGARQRGDDTRARVIREAAACVIEEGSAAASANRIALLVGSIGIAL